MQNLDSEDDGEIRQTRAFYIDEKTKLDENDLPNDGQQYLLSVRNEEKKFPSIMTKDLPEQKINANNITLDKNSEFLVDNVKPKKALINYILEEFKQFRLKIETIREKNKIKTHSLNTINFLKSNHLNKNFLKYYLESSHAFLINDLKELIIYFKETRKLAEIQAICVYNILGNLTLLMRSSDHAVLRELSCTLSKIRFKSNFDNDKETIKRCNLIIYIIGYFFEQFDIVESMIEE